MKSEPHYILDVTRASIVCERALVADRPLRRLRGLMGRRALPAGEGLLLQPAPSIHTGFMHFPIDVIFLDRKLHVVRLVEALAPWRTASARGARAVLELAAGEIARRKVEVGDVLAVIDRPRPAASLNGTPCEIAGAVDSQVGNASCGAAPPTRVLLIGSDRRFRAVVAALLKDRGCSVTLAERMTDVCELVQRDGAECVILDAGAEPWAAIVQAARIHALEPRVGVVIVGEEPLSSSVGMTVLAKWGSFEDLYGAVQVARAQRIQRRP